MGNVEDQGGKSETTIPGEPESTVGFAADKATAFGGETPTMHRGRLRFVAALVAIAAAGALFGLPSLPEPFGVDQGIYGYIAERILEGAVDHRDVFDHKPPGIHFAYVLAFFVFGRHMWSVWLLDLLVAILTGCGLYAVGRRLVGHRVGLICGLLYAAYYEVVFDWMSRAQPEAWVNLTFVWSLALLLAARGPAALLGSGALLAVGLWFKPTLLLLLILWIAALASRAVFEPGGGWRRLLGWSLHAAAGGLAFSAIVLSYYVANGALRELYGALVVFNVRYHTSAGLIHGLGDTWKALASILLPLYPLTFMMLGAVAVPFFADRRRPVLLGFGWLALAFGTVFWQGSFQKAHYILVLAPLVLLAALFLDGVLAVITHAERLDTRAKRLASFVVVLSVICLVAVNIQGVPGFKGKGIWGDRLPWFIALKTGRITRAKYYSAFRFPGRPYTFEDLRQMGAYLERRTPPDDTIFVWGFRPLIAYLAKRRMPTRFCFRYPLTRANNPRWWNEFLMDLDRSPPAFFVVATADRGRYHPTTSKVALERNEALRRFLHSRYEPDRIVPGFEIYRRRAEIARRQ